MNYLKYIIRHVCSKLSIPLHRAGNGHFFSDFPGNFVVFIELLYLPSITCNTTGKVAREVGEIGS